MTSVVPKANQMPAGNTRRGGARNRVVGQTRKIQRRGRRENLRQNSVADTFSCCALRAGCLWVRGVGGELADYEFLEEVGGGGFADADERVLKCQFRAIAILGRIVEVGDAASREAADDAGIIWLPVSIVALADDRIGERVENA